MTESEPDERSATADQGTGSAATDDDDHLRNVPDGAGCFEIWEHLSEQWAAENGEDDAEE